MPLILSISFLTYGKNASPKIIVHGDNGVYTINLKVDALGECSIENENAVLQKIIKSETVSPKNARLQLVDFKTPKVIKEESGKTVDETSFFQDIKSAKDLGGGEIALNYKTVLAEIDETQVEKSTYLRGQFTTYFSQNPSRVENIKLATKSLNNAVIYSGNDFSFNETVGKRTSSRGYKTAKIIVNGKFVEGVGGGVCQASSTLYNALLFSDLPILEHHAHSLKVSYVEPSFDAMVTDNKNDLRCKNDTNLPIYIFGKVTTNAVIFKIYGEKMNYQIERESVVLSEILPKIKYVYSESLPFGEENVIVQAKKGCYSMGYVKKIVGGKVEKKVELRRDKYLSIDGVTEINNNSI